MNIRNARVRGRVWVPGGGGEEPGRLGLLGVGGRVRARIPGSAALSPALSTPRSPRT